MDEVVNTFEKLGVYWGYVVAALVAASGWYAAWSKHWGRIARVLLLVDGLHVGLGPDPARTIVKALEGLGHQGSVRETRMQLVEELLSVAIYVCGADGKCEFTNSTLAELFGIERADCLGFGWLAAIEGSDRERVHKHWTYCVQNKIPYECTYTVANARTHERIRVKTKALPVYIDGEIECYVGSLVIEE